MTRGYQFLGVAGEKAEDPLEAARKRDLAELKMKLIAGAVLSVLVHAVSAPHLFPFLHSVPSWWLLFASFVMTTPVVFWVGSRFIVGAYKAALQRHFGHEHPCVRGSALRLYLFICSYFFPSIFRDCWGVASGVFRRRGHDRHTNFAGSIP